MKAYRDYLYECFHDENPRAYVVDEVDSLDCFITHVWPLYAQDQSVQPNRHHNEVLKEVGKVASKHFRWFDLLAIVLCLNELEKELAPAAGWSVKQNFRLDLSDKQFRLNPVFLLFA